MKPVSKDNLDPNLNYLIYHPRNVMYYKNILLWFDGKLLYHIYRDPRNNYIHYNYQCESTATLADITDIVDTLEFFELDSDEFYAIVSEEI